MLGGMFMKDVVRIFFFYYFFFYIFSLVHWSCDHLVIVNIVLVFDIYLMMLFKMFQKY